MKERIFRVGVVRESIFVMEQTETEIEGPGPSRPALVPFAAGSSASCAAAMKGLFAAMLADGKGQ